ncbi:MAG: HEAT repeat domain-containing protein [Elusimicrobiota bacterium]
MKKIMTLLTIGVVGYLAWERLKPAPPPPPPPPPPPAILIEPAPVIDPVEQAKIVKSADDPDPEVRWEAVVLLDKMKSPEAMPLMLRMLQRDMDTNLRTKIVELLGDRNPPQAMQALSGALSDQEPEVRLAAIRALEKIGDYAAAPVLSAGPIRDQEEAVRLQALKTLNALQDKKHLEIEAARKAYEAQSQGAVEQKR